jgi:hypothetical protein
MISDNNNSNKNEMNQPELERTTTSTSLLPDPQQQLLLFVSHHNPLSLIPTTRVDHEMSLVNLLSYNFNPVWHDDTTSLSCPTPQLSFVHQRMDGSTMFGLYPTPGNDYPRPKRTTEKRRDYLMEVIDDALACVSNDEDEDDDAGR